MAASNEVVGRAKISLGALGEIATEKGATLDPGGIKRNPKPADNGRVYFNSETAVPEMNCKVMATPAISGPALNIEGATVLFETDIGQKYMMVNAFTLDPAPLDAGAGTYDLKMSAESVEEI
ncbi:phage tail tube protein [Methylomonas sp. 11b]|uniref:phage tail tube protein n=1 Tax=Methylomonas sp. 11b TaxID=1168169 RepID=UPI0004788EE4|nr:phage tail tube protein [Methylomonas sp. 11b]